MSEQSQSFGPTKSSIRWNLASKILGAIVHIGSMYFINKLIGPDVFGLIYIALLITTIGTLLWSLELPIVLIRDPEVNDIKYSTVFWSTLGVGILFFLFFFFASDFLAKIAVDDNRETVSFLIKIFSITFVVQPFQIKAATELRRALKYDVISIVHFSTRIVVTALGLYLAYKGEHLWALICILGLLPIVQSLIFTIYGRWLPKFKFDKNYLRQNLKLGSSLLFGKIIGYLSETLDQLLIGKFYGETLTGEYGKSIRLQTMPKTYIAAGVSEVMFPSLSQKNIDQTELGNRFNKAGKLLAFMLYPVFSIAFAMAPEFSAFYFDENWNLKLITLLIRIFCVLGLFSIFELLFESLLRAKSGSRFIFNIVGIKKILIIIGILITFKISVLAIAISRLVTEILAFTTNLFVYKKEIKHSRIAFLKGILPTFLAALLGGFAAWGFGQYAIPNLSNGIKVLGGTTIGCMVYGISIFIIDRSAFNNFTSFLRR